MSSQSRAILAFTAVGIALVVVALVVTHVGFGTSGVDNLPSLPKTPPGAPAGAGVTVAAPPEGAAPRLLQTPTLSATEIAFAFAGEIWVVGREGGEARRLVTGQRANERPIFSPDGSSIAFTGTYDGNSDVYVVPSAGGDPTRLTYHPGPDEALGWTPDGTRVLMLSLRETARDLPKLFTVAKTGGFPEALPLPSGADASFSPDGKRLAYVPFTQWQPAWKRYRGGQTTPIWIADLSDSKITKVPRDGSNDRLPFWVHDTVYFLSDRNGPFTLFADDVRTNTVREVVPNPDGFDVRYASAGPGAIVYEKLGELHLYDLATGKSHLVPVTISGDLPQTRPRFERVQPDQVLHAAVSPTGKRVLLEARGEILSVPAEKGDVRNLTKSPGAADRDPAWSPDGKWIAWLSDASGEYALMFRSPSGIEPEKKIDLGEPPSYFYSPRWSPDSKKIVLTDKRLNLWLVDIDHPKPVKVDTDRIWWGSSLDPHWSPDSRWIVYTKKLPNHLHGVYVYSLDDKSIHAVTDGRSDAWSAAFGRTGKYLWFLARTDFGLNEGDGGEMTRMGHPSASSVYAAVLRKELPSPVSPESDEEGDLTVAGKKKEKVDAVWGANDAAGKDEKGEKGDKADKAEQEEVKPVRIDFEDIDQRIVALPIDRAHYEGLVAGAKGVIFLVAGPVARADEDVVEAEDAPPLTVTRFDLKTRKTETFLPKIDGELWGGGDTFFVTADGKNVLYTEGHKWFLAPSDKPPKSGDGEVKLGGVTLYVDPRAEWRQIYHEVWRIERDFLYDPGHHGLDLDAAEKLYGRFVDGIASRADLNALLTEALSNLALGHVWVRGGAAPPQDRVGVGLLGADFRVVDGRYQFARILRGENWSPKTRAPLTEPGVDVREGDFLLAVNGQDLSGTDSPERLLQGTAGKQTVLTVAPIASGRGSHPVTVVPVGSEWGLRLRTWMEDTRRRVDDLSDGRLGYVYIPDTGWGGYTHFNRYYFSQVNKQGVIVDERYNHGGQFADYMIDVMKWTPLMGAVSRDGDDVVIPTQAIFGPKVMICNQGSGSGGDALPWLFKKSGVGTLVGVRTWGGYVWIGDYPKLMDGGSVTAPRWAPYGPDGDWEIENRGVTPDVEVEQDPALVRQGHDPQLERAVQIALDALAKNPPKKLVRPSFPRYTGLLPSARTSP